MAVFYDSYDGPEGVGLTNSRAASATQWDKYKDHNIYVDVSLPPFSDFIDLTSGQGEEKYTGAPYMMDAVTAAKLCAHCEKTNVIIKVNSAYRSDDRNIAGGFGTSHQTGQAVDIINVAARQSDGSFIFPDDAGKHAESVSRFTASIASDPSSGLFAGKEFYKDPNENNHVEDQYNRARGVDAEAKEKHTIAVENANREYAQKKEAAEKEGRTLYGYIMDANGTITVMPAPFGDVSTLAQSKDYVLDPGDFRNTKEYLNAGTTNSVSGLSDKKYTPGTGGMTHFPSYPSLQDLTDRAAGNARAIEIDKTRMDKINDMSRMKQSEMQAGKYTLNKLIKNAYTDMHPFGLANKHEGPPASIKLVLDKLYTDDQRTKSATDAWAALERSGVTYIDCFFLERSTMVSEERYQISQSITDEYKIYFSGKRPTVMSIQGRMLNTYNQQWWYDFEYFYDNYLRGSKAVENKIRAFFTIADKIYEILILKFGANSDSVFDNTTQFSLDYIVLQSTYTGGYQNPVNRLNSPMQMDATQLSNAQTEYSDETQQVTENSNTVQSLAQNGAYRGTSASTSTIDPSRVYEGTQSLTTANASGASPFTNNTYALNPSQGDPQVEQFDKKIARDSLKNTPYAQNIKQQNLSKTNINSMNEKDLAKTMSEGFGKLTGEFGNINNQVQQGVGDFNTGLADNKYALTTLNKDKIKQLQKESVGTQAAAVVKGVNEVSSYAANYKMASDVQQALTGKPLPAAKFAEQVSKIRIDEKILSRDINRIGTEANKINNILGIVKGIIR